MKEYLKKNWKKWSSFAWEFKSTMGFAIISLLVFGLYFTIYFIILGYYFSSILPALIFILGITLFLLKNGARIALGMIISFSLFIGIISYTSVFRAMDLTVEIGGAPETSASDMLINIFIFTSIVLWFLHILGKYKKNFS